MKMSEYERFVELYNSPITVRELVRILGINYYCYAKYRKQALEEGRISLRRRGNCRRSKREIKNIHRASPWYNQFNIKHDNEYFCCVKGYNNALKIVERLEACGWDKNQVSRIKKEVLSEP